MVSVKIAERRNQLTQNIAQIFFTKSHMHTYRYTFDFIYRRFMYIDRLI